MFGIRMSISTTAGVSAAASSIACEAVGGLADHGDARLAGQDDAEAGPDQALVVGDEDGDRAAIGLGSGA